MLERGALLIAVFFVFAIPACAENSDLGPEAEDHKTQDNGNPFSDEKQPDASTENPSCPWPTGDLPDPSASLPAPKSIHRGIDKYEQAAYEKLREVLLKDPGVHFVATYSHSEQSYRIDSMLEGQEITLSFQRIAGEDKRSSFQVLNGDLGAIFPSEDPDLFPTYLDLLNAFENPLSSRIPNADYQHNDPRVGFLPPENQSYPLVMERIATLFDAPDAPDLSIGLHPWAQRSVGVHGGLSLLQSRSTLIFSGPGVRVGATLEKSANLVDIAPTILAMLGANTVGGVGHDGVYDDGLYLGWQDGRVLTEIFEPESCARPMQALVILFDGLLPTELLHQLDTEKPDIDLPNFRRVRATGTTFQTGAVSNFPSVSAPGHMTAGSGVWSGHHGVIANSVFKRTTRERVSVFTLMDDIQGTLSNPQQLYEIYEASVSKEVETLAQAVHRNFGTYDAEKNTGAFTAVLNDLPIGGADYTTVDFLVAGGAGSTAGASVTTYGMADSLAINQVETLLGGSEFPVPKLLEVSLFTTDAAGESNGPHSDLLRLVLKDMDNALGQILDAYEERGALDKTLIVLTSDHGMELQDPSRHHDLSTSFTTSGVKIHNGGSGLLYLPTMRLETIESSSPGELSLKIVDHWNDQGIEGVVLDCASCSPTQQISNAAGEVILRPETGTKTLEITATHDTYNPQTMNSPWPIP